MSQIQQKITPIKNYFRFLRNIYGEDLLEDFLISAVASILVIRLFLSLTGYPQLGVSGLHFAHMLWGGILMLVSIFILLGFLSRPAHEWAAALGGIGFGAFIDEIGKFLTNDSNYFFQPTVAIIYVTFILIYVATRAVFDYRPLSREEKLANVFEILKQASVNGLDKQNEKRVNDLLDDCDPYNPVVIDVKKVIPQFRIVATRQPHIFDRAKNNLDAFYQKIIVRWWFAGVIITFFAVTAITGFSTATALIVWPWTLILGAAAAGIVLLSLLQFWHSRIPNLQIPLSVGIVAVTILLTWAVLINRNSISLPFIDWAIFFCSSVSSVLIVMGIVLIAHHRLTAFRMFHRAILISVLLTQIFTFYEYQFYALIGLFLNLVILFGVRYMINHEQSKIIRKPIDSTG
jgi:hypothetical protein